MIVLCFYHRSGVSPAFLCLGSRGRRACVTNRSSSINRSALAVFSGTAELHSLTNIQTLAHVAKPQRPKPSAYRLMCAAVKFVCRAGNVATSVTSCCYQECNCWRHSSMRRHTKFDYSTGQVIFWTGEFNY